MVARELWRHRIRAGTRAAALGTPGNRKARGRKALWRDIANNAAEHSAATVGAASKGRSPALAMMKELRRTYPNILPADCAEGAL